jgi:hypothetical protein
MENLEAMQMLISTEHRFPAEKDKQFEKEKLLIADAPSRRDGEGGDGQQA